MFQTWSSFKVTLMNEIETGSETEQSFRVKCKATEAREAKFLAQVNVSWQQVHREGLDLLLPSPALLPRTNVWPAQCRTLDPTLRLLRKRQEVEREGKDGLRASTVPDLVVQEMSSGYQWVNVLL